MSIQLFVGPEICALLLDQFMCIPSLGSIPGFEQAVQAYAIHVLSLTYQRLKISRSVLAETINVEGLSLDKFIDHHVSNLDWAIEKSQAREKSQNKGQFIILP
ncbi:eukaryotic translation initiation factor 3 subunit K-like [Olea europaea var. sylvestris]|uniref:eukaryotic translation initiation factor 3 subunit K-like n=1 Tax=Olea europaea var. sylvestris TaxID=158386 RepID=UPI000C1D8469|nr:eukaryotic translation initiation factor 3 subunit K-like [Olea europaea var. sylvestris]